MKESWEMPDYYVALVKEYLECQDFIVRTETKYRIREKDIRGAIRTSWGDIDILAVKVEDYKISEIIVGEVKAEEQTEKEIQKIDEYKFENPHAKRRLHELLGSSQYKKCLYCWDWKPETEEFAKKLGIIPVSFGKMVEYLLKKVEEHKGWLYLRDYPNLMLLQFLQAGGYLKKT